jgi:hypothetical protein
MASIGIRAGSLFGGAGLPGEDAEVDLAQAQSGRPGDTA